MKKTILPLLIIFGIALIIILFIPFPTRPIQTEGQVFTCQNDTIIDVCEGSFRGRILRYIIHQDRLRGRLVIRPDSVKEVEGIDLHVDAPVFVYGDGSFYAASSRYSGISNRMVPYSVILTKDLKYILFQDEALSGRMYILSADGEKPADLKALLKSLQME